MQHFAQNRQMLFLTGPRQVGKTTISLNVAASRKRHIYLNWDDQKDRKVILAGPESVALLLNLDMPEINQESLLILKHKAHYLVRYTA